MKVRIYFSRGKRAEITTTSGAFSVGLNPRFSDADGLRAAAVDLRHDAAETLKKAERLEAAALQLEKQQ